MPALVDITGQRFGRWLVLNRSQNIRNRPHFNCVCDCGTKRVVESRSLTNGKSKSCGCLHSEMTIIANTKHSLKHTEIYHTWLNIIQRTTQPNNKDYHSYGGRGIKMHPKWEGDAESFVKYLRMALGPKPTKQHSLDRIDNDQGYFPGNLRWATKKEQANNRRPRQRKSA